MIAGFSGAFVLIIASMRAFVVVNANLNDALSAAAWSSRVRTISSCINNIFSCRRFHISTVLEQLAAFHTYFPETTMIMDDLDLTFGIELEFICVYPQGIFEPILGANAEQSAGNYIFCSMRQNGVPATGHEDDDEIFACDLPSYSSWRVEDDKLVLSAGERAYVPAGCSVEAIELSSRKFRYAELCGPRATHEIATVFGILKELQNLGCVILTNQSTGFHTHVGNGEEKVPLRTAKNLLKLVSAFERCFDQIHTAPRIAIPETFSYNGGEYNHCYAPPSFFHANNAFAEDNQTMSGRLAVIDATDDYEGLGSLFSCDLPELGDILGPDDRTHGKLSAYNFDNLFPSNDYDRCEEDLKRTIEFRQHAGTVNYEEVMAWIMLTCQLVRFSHTATDEQITELCGDSGDLNVGLVNVLRAIELPEVAIQHYADRLSPAVNTVQSENIALLRRALQAGFAHPMQALIAQNAIEEHDRFASEVVKEAIQKKAMDGCYGVGFGWSRAELEEFA